MLIVDRLTCKDEELARLERLEYVWDRRVVRKSRL